MGKVFAGLTNERLVAKLVDIPCDFKCFNAADVRTIFQLRRMEGWGVDTEILFSARRLGYRIKDVPVG